MLFKNIFSKTKNHLDIWEIWSYPSVIVKKSENPVINNEIYVYTTSSINEFSLNNAELCLQKHGFNKDDDATYQIDNLVEMLYYATFRVKCDINIYMQKDICFRFTKTDLIKISSYIDYLSCTVAYNSNTISLQQFINAQKDTIVFYSTPLGNDMNGNPKLYCLNTNQSNFSYLPIFLKQEHLVEFYKDNRAGFMILNSTLEQYLNTLDSNELLSRMGVVIEPMKDCNIAIEPGIRVIS